MEAYLKDNNKVLAVICNIDKNDNEYNHVFYLCDKGDADSTAWSLEIKKMEDVMLWETTVEEAKSLGLKSIEDCYNYQE